MTHRLTVLALITFLSISPTAEAAEEKVACVDMQRAIQATSTGQKAKKELERQFGDSKAELQKKQRELQAKDETFRKQIYTLSDEARTKRQKDLQSELAKFQQDVAENQAKLQKTQGELTEPIITRLQQAVEKIAKGQGFRMVLEKSAQGVLYAENNLDLTDDVVKEYEQSLSSETSKHQ